MTRTHRFSTGFQAWVVAALMTLIAACGGSDPPPAPPAPAPFQPQVVVVDLGSHGGRATLVSTQAGGWTLNGESFSSGSTAMGSGGRTYRLTLTSGTWTAEFVPPDPESIALGGSGDSVALQRQEDGSYQLGGTALTSGEIRQVDSGNRYRFVLGTGGTWSAEFVAPDPVSVALGRSGRTALVQALEDGTYQIAGEPLASGDVRDTGNGLRYRFILGSNGTWSAEFAGSEPIIVTLGSTTATVAITRLESGQFQLEGLLLGSGDVRTFPNGNRYRFVLDASGAWTAEYVGGEPVIVRLGSSAASVAVTRLESGQFELEGNPLASGEVVRFPNGNSYRFVLSALGLWTATYVVEQVRVELGELGGSTVLERQENGTFTRNGIPVANDSVVQGVNGREYRLRLRAGGWSAELVPVLARVTVLGSTDSFDLVQEENGTFTIEGQRADDGGEVRVEGSTYELRFRNGIWTASFLYGEVVIELGSSRDTITVELLPDGTYEYDGRRIRNGSVVTSPRTGTRYRLRLVGNEWSSSEYTLPTGGGGGSGGTPTTTVQNLEDALPAGFLRDSGGRLQSRVPAQLVKAGQSDVASVDYGNYDGSGSVETGTFVDAARRELQAAVDEISGLADGTDSEEFVARVVIADRWPKVRAALGRVFTNGATLLSDLPASTDSIDEDARLDDLEDLLAAMGDEGTFEDEVVESFGEFSSLGITDRSLAEAIFQARKGAFTLATTEHARFGVLAEPSGVATAQAVASASTRTFVTRAFAWSPSAATATSSLPSRGTARFSGRTYAADPAEGNVYQGTIQLRASIGIEYIEAEITGLRDTDSGADFRHDGDPVAKITLPTIQHGEFDNNGGFAATGSPTARIEYSGTNSLFPNSVSAEFRGHFVGTSSSPAEEVFGAWAIKADRDTILLDGSYAAEYDSTDRTVLPSSDNDGLQSEAEETSLLGDARLNVASDGLILTELPNEPFTIAELYGSSSVRSDSEGDNTGRVVFRATDYTRLGAWATFASGDYSKSGAFGYATLAETSYSGSSDNNYPRNVTATYSGATSAVDSEGNLFDGDVAVSVQWNHDSVGGEVVAIFSDLRNASSGGSFEISGQDVDRIGFRGTFTGVTFQVNDPSVEYRAGGSPVTRSGLIGGEFLGTGGTDGPFAVMGNWSMQENRADVLRGAFGADLVPEP